MIHKKTSGNKLSNELSPWHAQHFSDLSIGMERLWCIFSILLRYTSICMAGLMCAALRQMQTDLQRSILQSLAALLPWHISAEQSPKAFIGHRRIQGKNSGPNSHLQADSVLLYKYQTKMVQGFNCNKTVTFCLVQAQKFSNPYFCMGEH